MKLTVKREITEEIEVPGEFPVFIEHYGDVYKFFDQETYIEVSKGKSGHLITGCMLCKLKAIADKVLKEGTAITEYEFTSYYDAHIAKLDCLIKGETKLSKAS